jgi:hypothetical protein
VTSADHCCVIEHLDSSPFPSLALEEILKGEGLRPEVRTALVSLFQALRSGSDGSESCLDTDEICEALDGMDLDDVLVIVRYGAAILKAATPPASTLNPGEAKTAPE